MEFKNPELFQLLNVAKKAASMADEILLENFGRLSTVEHKERAGLVTNVDRESEQAIIDFFGAETPDFAVLGEESTYFDPSLNQKDCDRPRWIIDPLDGTMNYVHQVPIFCVSIGLEYKGDLLAGVISVPKLGEIYTATKGGGAFKNDVKIQVSEQSKLKDSLLATGFITHKPDMLAKQMKIFDSLVPKVRGVRRIGTAAYDLAMVASGVFDGYWESQLSPWDSCAGALLVEEAGGQVTRYDGAKYSPFDDTILATNRSTHGKIQSELSIALD